MTVAARSVLDDCKGALDELVDGVQGSTWRRRWITAVVLLRAVGHVLEKVDSRRSPLHDDIISRAWKSLQATKPEPKIFWEFINETRNSIIKEYEMSAGQGATVRLSGIELNLRTGETKIDPPLPTLYHYTINSGSYQGRDQRDVLSEAIIWWENYLGRIDNEVLVRSSSQETPDNKG